MSRVYTDKPGNQSFYEERSRPNDSAEFEEQDDLQDDLQDDTYPSRSTRSNSQEQEARRSTGGYHVFPPDRRKQEKMRRIAEAEEREAERLKLKRRSQLQSETRTLGGGDVSSEMVRERQEMEARRAKYQRKFKQEEHKRKESERVEAEYRQKKEEARRKAQKLESKEKQQMDLRREETRAARLKRFGDKG